MTSQIDVTKPEYGTPTTQSVRDNFTTAANEITALQNQTAGAPFLSLIGGRMTGAMYLFNDPTDAMMPATKGYVDAASGSGGGGIPEAPADGFTYGRNDGAWLRALALAGGTLTGPLLLAADPGAALGAATKQYVDTSVAASGTSHVLKAGDTMTGPLVLPGVPTLTNQAATKGYVDTSISAGVAAAPFLPIAGGTLTGSIVAGGAAVPANVKGPVGSFGEVLLPVAAPLYWNCYTTSGGTANYIVGGYAAQIQVTAGGGWYLAVYPSGAAGAQVAGGVTMTFDQTGLLTVPSISSTNLTAANATVGSTMKVGNFIATNPAVALLSVENPYGLASQFMCSMNAPGATAIQVRSDRGDGSALYFSWGASTGAGSIVINGATTTYNTASDYRLKRVDGPTDGALVREIPVYQGARLHAPDTVLPMILAHELQAVAPWAVIGSKDAMTKDGDIQPQMVDLSTLIPAIIAFVQTLDLRLMALEAAQ